MVRQTLVTCRYCGKRIPKESASYEQKGKTKVYYCHEHFQLKTECQKMFEQMNEIHDLKSDLSTFKKAFSPIADEYGWNITAAYFRDQKQYLEKIVKTKNFTNYKGMVNYFAAIFRNHIADFKPPVILPDVVDEVITDIDNQPQVFKKRRKRAGLNIFAERK